LPEYFGSVFRQNKGFLRKHHSGSAITRRKNITSGAREKSPNWVNCVNPHFLRGGLALRDGVVGEMNDACIFGEGVGNGVTKDRWPREENTMRFSRWSLFIQSGDTH